MRSVDRIPEFLDKIAKLWIENCPDLRFGQLMINFISYYGDPRVFYLEESDFLEAFAEYLNSIKTIE